MSFSINKEDIASFHKNYRHHPNSSVLENTVTKTVYGMPALIGIQLLIILLISPLTSKPGTLLIKNNPVVVGCLRHSTQCVMICSKV